MPPVHKRAFRFLVTFMKELLEHSEVNGLDPKVLGKNVRKEPGGWGEIMGVLTLGGWGEIMGVLTLGSG